MALSKFTRTRLINRDGKKVRAHRWIMEQRLGRKLLPTEEVHHINHDPLDNRFENLTVMTHDAHVSLHAEEKRRYPDIKTCVLCGTEFRVNPRKRSRNKTCSARCAQSMRTAWRKKGRPEGRPELTT